MVLFKPKFNRHEAETIPSEEEEIEEEFVDDEVPTPQPIQKKQVVKQPAQVQEGWRVEEVPTQTQPVIYNSKTKKVYTFYEALAELLNRSEN